MLYSQSFQKNLAFGSFTTETWLIVWRLMVDVAGDRDPPAYLLFEKPAMNHFRLSLVAVLVYALLPGSAQAVDLPSGGRVAKVDFERHVMGLLSKTGDGLRGPDPR
jgi:hypothetical protein